MGGFSPLSVEMGIFETSMHEKVKSMRFFYMTNLSSGHYWGGLYASHY